jgi:hypothetical protein
MMAILTIVLNRMLHNSKSRLRTELWGTNRLGSAWAKPQLWTLIERAASCFKNLSRCIVHRSSFHCHLPSFTTVWYTRSLSILLLHTPYFNHYEVHYFRSVLDSGRSLGRWGFSSSCEERIMAKAKDAKTVITRPGSRSSSRWLADAWWVFLRYLMDDC